MSLSIIDWCFVIACSYFFCIGAALVVVERVVHFIQSGRLRRIFR